MDPYSFITAFSMWARREPASPPQAPPQPAVAAPAEPALHVDKPLDPLFKELVYPSLTIRRPTPAQEESKVESRETAVEPAAVAPRPAKASVVPEEQTVGQKTAAPQAEPVPPKTYTVWRMVDSDGVVWQGQDKTQLQLWIVGRNLRSLSAAVSAAEARMASARARPAQVQARPATSTGYVLVYPRATYQPAATYQTYGYTYGGCASGRCGR